MRRVILLQSVGFIPPYRHPSDACLDRGSSVQYSPLHAAQGDTTLGVAGVGHGPLPAVRTGGIFRGHQAHAFHQCSWSINMSEIANG